MSDCRDCPVGSYSMVGSPTCELCPPGSHGIGRRATNVSSCHQCPPGTYSTTAGSAACWMCDAGKHSTADATRCIACPAGWHSIAGSTNCTLRATQLHSINGDFRLWAAVAGGGLCLIIAAACTTYCTCGRSAGPSERNTYVVMQPIGGSGGVERDQPSATLVDAAEVVVENEETEGEIDDDRAALRHQQLLQRQRSELVRRSNKKAS